jgi:hypothetical protein
VSLPDVNPEQQAYWFHLPIPRYFNLDFNLLVCSFLQGHQEGGIASKGPQAVFCEQDAPALRCITKRWHVQGG